MCDFERDTSGSQYQLEMQYSRLEYCKDHSSNRPASGVGTGDTASPRIAACGDLSAVVFALYISHGL